jgi:hypothetical protein
MIYLFLCVGFSGVDFWASRPPVEAHSRPPYRASRGGARPCASTGGRRAIRSSAAVPFGKRQHVRYYPSRNSYSASLSAFWGSSKKLKRDLL